MWQPACVPSRWDVPTAGTASQCSSSEEVHGLLESRRACPTRKGCRGNEDIHQHHHQLSTGDKGLQCTLWDILHICHCANAKLNHTNTNFGTSARCERACYLLGAGCFFTGHWSTNSYVWFINRSNFVANDAGTSAVDWSVICVISVFVFVCSYIYSHAFIVAILYYIPCTFSVLYQNC